MTLLLRAARLLLGAIVVASATPACFGAGSGTDPPRNSFYFPVGLAVSAGGNALYAVNSDFDLQWSGGTIQSYDLHQIRQDAIDLITYNTQGGPAPAIPYVTLPAPPPCVFPTPAANPGVALGQACSPPIDSTSPRYVKDSVIIGAFATDLQLSIVPGDPPTTPSREGTRLFSPVRGTATLTWADVGPDDPSTPPPGGAGTTKSDFPPFALTCGQGSDDRCDGAHQVGNDPNSPFNTRNVTMPGEPFGMAQTEDGTAVAITSQTDTKTSLLTTGVGSHPPVPLTDTQDPTMQFVLDGLPVGGNGIATVPHDPFAAPPCPPVGSTVAGGPDAGAGEGGSLEGGAPLSPPCVRPAFLETTRDAAEVDLLRYYDDDGSSLHRPYLAREAAFPLTANAIGTDSRGIVIDPTPRMACEAQPGADKVACGQRPARVFFANRTPPSLVVGEIGEHLNNGAYDPDAFVVLGNVSLSDGPAKVYLAPIKDALGNYELRVFVVCFDTSSVFIFDPNDLSVPEQAVPEHVIYTGPGPFAMAFDPMPLECVAIGDPTSALWPTGCKQYESGFRFGYVASFTQSYVQLIDLDATTASAPSTFENVVFTLGNPTPPKGQ